MQSLFAILLAAFLQGTTTMPAKPQMPLAPLNELSDHSDFGIGFDLTASYGTAAISFSNGTFATFPQVPATKDYKRMMYRLSLDSSRHPSPPYDNFGDGWADNPRQWWRRIRKALGLPPSGDVARLAVMIKSLRSIVEEKSGISITSVAVTTMNLAALYQEDLTDACRYLGLEYLSPLPTRYRMLYETSLAFAGYGFGLCENFTMKRQCLEEQENMEIVRAMAVLFTPAVLSVSYSNVQSAYYLWEPLITRLVDFELGYDSSLRHTNEEQYWMTVVSRLEAFMSAHPQEKRPSKVILMGDGVDDPTFRGALQTVLDYDMDTSPAILGVEAELVAAKGAAELAKRIPWNPCKDTSSYNLW